MDRHDAQKVYLAFVRGDARWIGQQRVDRPLKDDKGVTRTASTLLDCLCGVDDGLPERSSLVRAMPRSGRWHQIRKHLNGFSHPIIGDSKHGDTRVNRWWRQEAEFRHLGLHCHEMHLSVPPELTEGLEYVHRAEPLHPADFDAPTATGGGGGGGDGVTTTDEDSVEAVRVHVRCPVRPDLISVWRELPWWDEACAKIPSLEADAVAAHASMLRAYATEDHLSRAAAAGRGVKAFHRW